MIHDTWYMKYFEIHFIFIFQRKLQSFLLDLPALPWSSVAYLPVSHGSWHLATITYVPWSTTSTRLLLILPWSSGTTAPWPSRGFLVIATLDYNAQTLSETWYNCGQNTQPLPIPSKSAGCLHSQVILICGWQMPNITDLSERVPSLWWDATKASKVHSARPPGDMPWHQLLT